MAFIYIFHQQKDSLSSPKPIMIPYHKPPSPSHCPIFISQTPFLLPMGYFQFLFLLWFSDLLRHQSLLIFFFIVSLISTYLLPLLALLSNADPYCLYLNNHLLTGPLPPVCSVTSYHQVTLPQSLHWSSHFLSHKLSLTFGHQQEKVQIP